MKLINAAEDIKQLTEHQQLVFDRVVSNIHCFSNSLLSGKAGTGKTFLTAKLISWYKDSYPDNKYIAICPSHKAKRNAIKMGFENDVSIEAVTIASFLGLKPVLDRDTGIEKFKSDPNKLTDTNIYDLVIVDEAFMVSKESVAAIQKAVKCSILWVGDKWQLPPIGEDNSILITTEYPRAELTEVIRYSGDLTRIVDTWAQSDISRQLSIGATPDGSIKSLNKVAWVESFCDSLHLAKTTI
jgi:AAA domain